MLFYGFIAIFILFSAVMVLIALGYGYDFVHNQIVKTGALGITSNVSSGVYINNKLEGSTSFLGNSFTKNRLLPNEYDVRIEKKDFTSWQKKVNINAGAYIDFPDVFLVSEHPQTKTVVAQVTPILSAQALYGDWLFYINKTGFLSYINIKSPDTPAVEFDGVKWSKITSKSKIIDFDENNKTMLISSSVGPYLLDLNAGSLKTLNNLPFNTVASVHLVNHTLYGLIKNQLTAYDTTSSTISPLIGGIKAFTASEASGDVVTYIDMVNKTLHIYSLSDKKELTNLPPPVGVLKIAQFIELNNSSYVILQGTITSTLYRVDTNKLTKLSDYVVRMLLSPDQNKLLYYNDHEVSVLYIRATSRQPYFNSGDQNLITRTTSTITNPTWYGNGEHLLANIGGVLTLLELDGRGGRNMYNLSDHIDGFSYDRNSDTIYVFKDGNLDSMSLK